MLLRMFTEAIGFAIFCKLVVAVPAGSDAANMKVEKRDYDGVATYYYQDGAAGSCGQYNSDSAMIVALSNDFMDNESPGPYCGQQITITNTGGGGDENTGVGNVVTATVADTCPSCDQTHVDCSVGVFEALTGGSLDPGVINIDWYFD